MYIIYIYISKWVGAWFHENLKGYTVIPPEKCHHLPTWGLMKQSLSLKESPNKAGSFLDIAGGPSDPLNYHESCWLLPGLANQPWQKFGLHEDVPSLKLTFSPLKMDGWNMLEYYFPIGKAYFQGLC